jgi:hypothetical protein
MGKHGISIAADTAESMIKDLESLVTGWRNYVAKNPCGDQFGRSSGYLAGLDLCADQLSRELSRHRAILADDPEFELLTHVPMACIACGRPVQQVRGLWSPSIWEHVNPDHVAECPKDPTAPILARVDA